MKLEQRYRYSKQDPRHEEFAIEVSKKHLAMALITNLEISTPENKKIYTVEITEQIDPFYLEPYTYPMHQYTISANIEMARQSIIWISKLDYDYKQSTMPKWLKSILERLYPDG